MRLLNVSTLSLQEFIGRVPPYAILSHTWGEQEVLFSDIGTPTAASKQGYAKLTGCCRKAAQDGFDWVWIDTCCIDKSSSAELTEAINSMYAWYQRATVCYAYLQDVTDNSLTLAFPVVEFYKSRWFTRGWTLQELIAPQTVELCSKEWNVIGTKRSLASGIGSVTGIPISVLRGANPSTYNVAERMSWASARTTTREEDLAYCLLGLFNVNMPLLYGEGSKSFLRLQEQILKQEEDYSIFAWTLQQDNGPVSHYVRATGFLAWSPAQFSNAATTRTSIPLRGQKPQDSGSYTPATPSKEAIGNDPIYQILHQKDYDRMFRSFDSIRAMRTAPNPPELTSRGLRVSLPVMTPTNHSLPAPTLAWLFYEVQDLLVCVFLDHDRETLAQVHCRAESTCLVGVPKSLLNLFESTELFIHPSGYFADSNTGYSPTSLFSSKRVKLLLKMQSTQMSSLRVVLAYPNDEWMKREMSMHDFSFRVLWICCTQGSQSSLFRIDFTISSDNASCSIRELPDSQTNDKMDEARKSALLRACAQYKKSFLAHADRSVKRSGRLPGTVFSSALNRKPTSKDNLVVYEMRVDAWDSVKCPSWVQLSLMQDQKEVDDGL
ncbi:hypothetical protein FPSE_08816 [Fusarium pseudograminearum CS3096]|uniref:Heterokaryon incompatibility domain-containing protein n=1 Tax=Fusarium pseudograminearum (strain CS3096) TaxID=1028729 RepID=K3VAX8_FUSPC|nr:hypothetical protein FPSE_08816 [Fusarium pseudograminearum CS3096]EKJ70957.1 hypothetical protein FPSE_08816 [Fusarium pseudograminearum CS3096]KAF0642791.1 hypothetical protein FPSE5266_08816 [Fusarium pseudograminearum]